MANNHSETALDLFSQCESNGCDPQDVLDDAVHTVSESIASENNPYDMDDEYDSYEAYMDEASQKASSINNQGTEEQIAYLTQHNAIDDVKKKLKALI